jgi:predicted ester cyclase
MEATHTGNWAPFDIEPTGETVSIRGNNIHHVEDGKIVDIWPQQDTLKMTQTIDMVELTP